MTIAGVSVTLRDVNYRRRGPGGRIERLDGITLDVAAGEAVAVVGAPLAGPTALLRVIGGLERPSAGTVRVGGDEVGALSRRASARFRRGVGFVFQHHQLLAHLNAVDNVMLPLMPSRSGPDPRGKALACLAEVGLADAARTLVADLGALERQRVALARSLVAEPRLLLADEPAGALDSRDGDVVLDLLADLHHAHGMTMIVATSDATVAALCGRLVTMRDGAVIGDRLLHDPRPDETLRRATGLG